MHYHCEIVMPPAACGQPPVETVHAAVEKIMAPFYEGLPDEERSKNAFWDWWVIGGRWAGDKNARSYGDEVVDQFYAWCEAEKITVSGIVCGKEELQPYEQVGKVDAKCQELTGETGPCPFFAHAGKDVLPGDICPLEKAMHVTCSHVIFAAFGASDDELRAVDMYMKSLWNGVTWQDTEFDGTMKGALSLYKKRLADFKDSYREKCTPRPDWTTVTVDYHS